MPIIRSARPDAEFYVIRNATINDKRLSWQARGMLVFLLAKPDNWRVVTEALVAETKDSRLPAGRDSVRAILGELVSTGYITREALRNEHGQMDGLAHFVHESPKTLQPETADPSPAKTALINTNTHKELKEQKEASADAPAPKGRKSSSPKTFDQWTAELKESGEQAIPETDPVFSQSAKMGIPEDLLSLAWFAFVSRYTGNPKRQKDWRHTFRNAVKDNWMGIWWIDDAEGYKLTTRGKQYQFAQANQSQVK